MKNKSILSKLFLVSALALPCGQAFGMKVVTEVSKFSAKQAFEKIKIESKKPGFWHRPIIKGIVYGAVGFTGTAFYNNFMTIRGKTDRTLSPTSIVITTLGTGVIGYLRGMVAWNGKMIEQVLKNQKNAAIRDEALRRYVEKYFNNLENNQEVLKKNQDSIKKDTVVIRKKVDEDNKENFSEALESIKKNPNDFEEIVNQVIKDKEEQKRKSWSYLKPWTWIS